MKQLLLLLIISISLSASNLTEIEKVEAKEAEKQFQEILKKFTLSRDVKKANKIKSIGMKLAKVIEKDYNWRFVLIENKTINAFCLPGGKVIFFTGIFDVIDNDDQISAVMSHEIAHVLLRHGGVRSRVNDILDIPQKIGKGVLGDLIPKNLHPILDTVHEAGKQLTVIMPYSRYQEIEADKLGVRIMKKAGYDPKEAIKLWENIRRASKYEIPDFLSTHPNHDERIRSIRAEIENIN